MEDCLGELEPTLGTFSKKGLYRKWSLMHIHPPPPPNAPRPYPHLG